MNLARQWGGVRASSVAVFVCSFLLAAPLAVARTAGTAAGLGAAARLPEPSASSPAAKAARGKKKGKGKKGKGKKGAPESEPVEAVDAAASDDKPPETADDFFEEGTTHHKLGEYEKAIAAYKEAYRIKADPVHLYNIALAYRQWGDHPADALRYYELYLAEDPASPLRKEVEGFIVELKAILGGAEAVGKKPPTTPADPAGTGSGDGSGTGDSGSAGSTDIDPGAGELPPTGDGFAALPVMADPPKKKKKSTGLIVGLSVGGVVLVAGGVALALALVLTGGDPLSSVIAEFPNQDLVIDFR